MKIVFHKNLCLMRGQNLLAKLLKRMIDRKKDDAT